ncbi:hypothetical protein GDO78_001732 [Eleutherodactylus coqui]|uniref:NADH dehydrogenase [ubiquinone] 1 beta subcomplex subunit 5, mitochondrial n=1 Tax=Eleutherodactylus coqui TaxID=57060 RepID=A0A8J6FWC3_ELECQ|nr:hypothetical protein GDO78_001732 [Eleutherodactylus coqui]
MAAMSLLRTAASSLVSRVRPGLRGVPGGSALLRGVPPASAVPVRFEGHGKRLFEIKATTYYDSRFLKLLKYYLLLAIVPSAVAITLINFFIGPAELAEIPEGYVPKNYEYYEHPITRFIVRCVYKDFQDINEQEMHQIHVISDKRLLRQYENIARKSMRENGDGPWHYYETLDMNLIDNIPKSTPDE